MTSGASLVAGDILGASEASAEVAGRQVVQRIEYLMDELLAEMQALHGGDFVALVDHETAQVAICRPLTIRSAWSPF